jgi:hypothetical protein
MKKWLWLLLVTLVAVLVMGIGGVFRPADTSVLVEKMPVEQPQLQATKEPQDLQNSIQNLINAPVVSGAQLLNHLQKLDFQRYTDRERSRTRIYITNQLRKFGWQPKLEKFAGGVNIFAERLGTDQAAGAILMGAHYDTVLDSPGADDNGTGVAVLLESARLFGSLPTPKTLQLAFFDKEEAGLLGSSAFVSDKKHLENLQGAVILDMVGFACYTPGCQKYPNGLPITPPSDKGDFLAVVGDTENLSLLTAFANSQNSLVSWNKTEINLPSVLTLPVPLKGLLTPDTMRSDHAPFWLQGVGAVLVTDTAEFRTPHYHQPSDKFTTIDESFFTGAAQVIVNAVTNLLQK